MQYDYCPQKKRRDSETDMCLMRAPCKNTDTQREDCSMTTRGWKHTWEFNSYKPRKAKKASSFQKPGECMVLPTPRFWTRTLQKCERIRIRKRLCCWKLLCLWHFVVAALANDYTNTTVSVPGHTGTEPTLESPSNYILKTSPSLHWH